MGISSTPESVAIRRSARLRLAFWLAAMLLVLLGLFVDFVPAAMFRGSPMLFLCLAIGAACTAAAIQNARGRGAWSGERLPRKLLAIFVTPLVAGLFCWLILAKALPWAYTRAFGETFRSVQLMQAHYSRSPRSCDYRLVGGLMQHGFPRYLCITEAAYRRFPEQQVPVLLTGERSVFGTRIGQAFPTR